MHDPSCDRGRHYRMPFWKFTIIKIHLSLWLLFWNIDLVKTVLVLFWVNHHFLSGLIFPTVQNLWVQLINFWFNSFFVYSHLVRIDPYFCQISSRGGASLPLLKFHGNLPLLRIYLTLFTSSSLLISIKLSNTSGPGPF